MHFWQFLRFLCEEKISQKYALNHDKYEVCINTIRPWRHTSISLSTSSSPLSTTHQYHAYHHHRHQHYCGHPHGSISWVYNNNSSTRLSPYMAMTQLAEIRPLLGRKIDPFFKSGRINSRTSPCLVPDVTVDCSMLPTTAHCCWGRGKKLEVKELNLRKFLSHDLLLLPLPHKAKTRQEMWYLICQGHPPYVFSSSETKKE